MENTPYTTGDYENDVKEDLGALQAERANLDPSDAEKREKIEGYISKMEELLAQLKEELNGGVHDIAGDPSTAKERFDVEAYNRKVDQMRGRKVTVDENNGVVLTDADFKPIGDSGNN